MDSAFSKMLTFGLHTPFPLKLYQISLAKVVVSSGLVGPLVKGRSETKHGLWNCRGWLCSPALTAISEPNVFHLYTFQKKKKGADILKGMTSPWVFFLSPLSSQDCCGKQHAAFNTSALTHIYEHALSSLKGAKLICALAVLQAEKNVLLMSGVLIIPTSRVKTAMNELKCADHAFFFSKTGCNTNRKLHSTSFEAVFLRKLWAGERDSLVNSFQSTLPVFSKWTLMCKLISFQWEAHPLKASIKRSWIFINEMFFMAHRKKQEVDVFSMPSPCGKSLDSLSLQLSIISLWAQNL